jgi:hypothetical protein
MKKIPKWKCRRCEHYYDSRCPLADLDPCTYAGDTDRPHYAAVIIIIGICIATIILFSCKRQEHFRDSTKMIEPQSAVQILRELNTPKSVGLELTDFDKLTLAIALTESRINPDAVGSNNDFGILQITPVFCAEANRISGLNFKHEDAFSIDFSLAMFAVIQDYYNPTHDIEEGIKHHNRSPYYRKTVLENLAIVERYETLRAKLIEQN